MSSGREPARSSASCACAWSRSAPRPPQRQVGVGGVDPRDDVAGADAVAFGDLHFEQPSADLGGDADLGGLDVAGGAVRAAASARPVAAGGESPTRNRSDEHLRVIRAFLRVARA